MDYFRHAIALDPTYALAYDGMSYYYQLVEDLLMAPSEAMPRAEEAARKASNYTMYDFDWPAAEREFGRALSLNPNDADAHEYYSWSLTARGRSDQAIREGRLAVELDPLSPEIHMVPGWDYYFARRYDLAVELHKSLELDPNFWLLRPGPGVCAAGQDRRCCRGATKVR